MSKVHWSVSVNSVWVLRELVFGKPAFEIWADMQGSKRQQGFRNTLLALERRAMIWRNPRDEWEIRILPYGHAVLDFLSRIPKADRGDADIAGEARAIVPAHSVSERL